MLTNLIAEWQRWCSDNELPLRSADELLVECYLNEQQYDFVVDFIRRWDEENADAEC